MATTIRSIKSGPAKGGTKPIPSTPKPNIKPSGQKPCKSRKQK